MSSQLPLPLAVTPNFSRENFIVAAGNAAATAFVDSWPEWPVSAAAICGPASGGKTHLATTWAQRSHALIVDAGGLRRDDPVDVSGRPFFIDNMDFAEPAESDLVFFSLLNRGASVLLVGRESPERWPVLLPDLASRLRALLTFHLWPLDDGGLAALAGKLFADRQLHVPPSVIARMLVFLERSPAAIRKFVERLDQEALSRKRAISVGLVNDLLSP